MSHKVLLIDDDPNVLGGLKRALHKESYEILTAGAADEAAQLLEDHAIDVIVSDEEMPGMSGTEFLARVAHYYPDIIRIVLTGHATLPMAVRAINEGKVYQFFTKPCNEVELAITIRRALEQKDLTAKSRELLELAKRQSALIEEAQMLRRLRGDRPQGDDGPGAAGKPPADSNDLLTQIGEEVRRGRALLEEAGHRQGSPGKCSSALSQGG